MTRWGRPIAVGLTVLFLGFAVLRLWATSTSTFAGLAGLDLGHYLDATRRWIDVGTPYLASEVAAPFDYAPLTFLHPPTSLPLFAAFLVLPSFLWWAIPLATVGAVVASFRPAVWTWPLMAACLTAPGLAGVIVVGNSDMWTWAWFALALRYGWPAVMLVALKPSLALLAIVGIRRPSMYVVGSVVAFLSIAFGDLWWQWIAVVLNSPGNLAYSIGNLPWLVLPAVAWAGRSR